MKAQIQPGKIFGIEIGSHYSWLFIALRSNRNRGRQSFSACAVVRLRAASRSGFAQKTLRTDRERINDNVSRRRRSPHKIPVSLTAAREA